MGMEFGKYNLEKRESLNFSANLFLSGFYEANNLMLTIMIRKLSVLLLFCILSGNTLMAHSGKPKYHVVIDTDGALDDMRAISMLLSANDVRVIAITCSQGTLYPDSVYVKVKSLLSVYHHEGIPVGSGKELDIDLPVWAPFAQEIEWGKKNSHHEDLNFKNNSTDILNRAVNDYKYNITLIALGSLKTYADWLKSNPRFINQVEQIVWYNDHEIDKGFNYRVSPDSYEFFSQSGITLEIVANNSDELFVTSDFLENIRNTKSIYAQQIELVHNQASVAERINQRHIHLWDDLVPLFLSVPILFESEAYGDVRYVSVNQGLPASIIYKTIGTLLESATKTNNRVFKNFPVDSSLYKPEYAGILNSTIDEFGLIEWKAISMTNEIHGHTGIYSIIGAKMGIRAMEYFNVGINNLTVTTFAGNKPPLSCFNDGIQISTGATIGQGLITVSDSISIIPTAVFEFNNQQVSISLKREISENMRKEIKYGVQNYGLLSDQYWLYIEELAIRYWRTFDRYEIFDLSSLSNGSKSLSH